MSNLPYRPIMDIADAPSGKGVSAPVAQRFDLFVGFAAILHIAEDAAAFEVGDCNIAEVCMVTDGILALTGKAVGKTDILVRGSDGGMLCALHVCVAADTPGAVTLGRTMH